VASSFLSVSKIYTTHIPGTLLTLHDKAPESLISDASTTLI
jgi:hypothetical protein